MKRLFSHWRATVCHLFQSLSAEVAGFCFAFEVTLYHLVLVCVCECVCLCACVCVSVFMKSGSNYRSVETLVDFVTLFHHTQAERRDLTRCKQKTV